MNFWGLETYCYQCFKCLYYFKHGLFVHISINPETSAFKGSVIQEADIVEEEGISAFLSYTKGRHQAMRTVKWCSFTNNSLQNNVVYIIGSNKVIE